RIADHEEKVRAICVDLIEGARARRSFDFVADVAAHLPMIMIGDMLGVAPGDRDDLLRWSDDMVSAQSGNATDEQYMKAMQAMEGYRGFCEHAVAERRARPTDDLMSTLVHAEVDGDRLEPDEVLHESLLILVGGDETTRHVVSGGMEQLLLHPDQHKQLLADPAGIPTAVEEMLRWVTPIKNMCRTVTRDVEFMGQELRAGQKCMLLYESANRDEAKFEDPYRFDVERQPNEHVAFGFGSHYCLGQALARLELNVMFERLLARLPDLELAADPASLPRRRANFISGLEAMPVRFSPSAPVAAR
ncbi:MAG TPA: cytochrome P450, partial [Acidimicrobiia bacterium]